jgi:hypothetical protein
MLKSCLYVLLVLLFLLAPVAGSSALLARNCGATLADSAPIYGGSSDELHYWQQIDAFKAAGFGSGYFVVNERTAPAQWSHFGPHGPAFPVLYGTLARTFGWQPATGPVFNLGCLLVGGITWLCLVRPGLRQLAAAALLGLTFWPLLLYVPATLQESFHCAVAFVLAGLAHRKLSGGDARDGPFIAAAAAASLVRVTWSLTLIAWAVVAMRGARRSARVATLAAVPGLFLAWQYAAAPYPNYLEHLASGLRERPAAAGVEYLAHVGGNLHAMLSTFVDTLTPFGEGLHEPRNVAALSRLRAAERYQALVLVLVGTYFALRRFPPARRSGAAVTLGIALPFLARADTLVIVGPLLALGGCWPRRGGTARPIARAAACTAVLGTLLALHYDPVLRMVLGHGRVFGIYLVLLAVPVWLHRDAIAGLWLRLFVPTTRAEPDARPYLFGGLNMALVCAAIICLYDVSLDRDYRVLGPHVLLSVLVLLTGAGYRAGVGLVALGLLAAPVVDDAFAGRHRQRFAPPDAIDLRPYLAYDGRKPAWDNTLLITDVTLKPRVEVPAGFGISAVVEYEDQWNSKIWRRRVLAAPKSRYLLMKADDAEGCRGGSLKLLCETRYGNLYLNDDGGAD